MVDTCPGLSEIVQFGLGTAVEHHLSYVNTYTNALHITQNHELEFQLCNIKSTPYTRYLCSVRPANKLNDSRENKWGVGEGVLVKETCFFFSKEVPDTQIVGGSSMFRMKFGC